MRLSEQVRVFVVTLVLMALIVLAADQMTVRSAEATAIECGNHPAVKAHFKEIIRQGETQSDWLTHMPRKCSRVIYLAGLKLNDALDDLEIPYTDEVDTH